MSDQRDSRPAAGPEVIRVGILLLILFFTVVIVALLRPVIFQHIVPAVLGWGNVTTTPLPIETVPAGQTPTAIPQAPTNTPEPPLVSEPTPQASPTPQIHTVQPGENLTTIANRYGVSIEAIILANNLTSPDQIQSGDQLIIPTN